MAELRRDLGVWGAASIVVGTVIGSGIFLVPKTMIQKVGSVEMVFLVWIAAGLLSLAGALTYAELAAAMSEAGGEYVYLREAYGPFFGFIYGWTQLWVAKSGSVATLATGFFYYLANFYPSLEGTLYASSWIEIRIGQLAAIGVIVGLGILNFFGVKWGGGVQIAVTVVKVGCILAIILAGISSVAGNPGNFKTAIPAVGGLSGFFAAMVAALWAYDGWNNVTMVASEIKQPQRNLPLALTAGTALVIALYLGTNVAYFYLLNAGEVAASNRVAGAAMSKVFGDWGAAAVSVAAMISMFAAINGSILSGSRVPYAMSRDGLFFRALGHVHANYHTPAASILALSAWSALLVLSGRYEQLFTYVIFASWILYALATASVIVLRFKRPDLPRPYRTVGYPVVPILFVLVAVALLGNTLIESPRESILGLLLIFAGIPFYVYWKRSAAVRKV
ncbi:MAG: amino acid permease [Bryobacterales bacterium]|nr:amino acid permease [Bryobacterales bacterium]